MDELGDEIYQLPISGHYDCGYSYGAESDLKPPPPPAKDPVQQHQQSLLLTKHWSFNTSFDDRTLALHLDSPRPISPPVTLPNSFTHRGRDVEAESDLSSLSSRSRQTSALSDDTIITTFTSPATSRPSSTREISNGVIEPDPLPSHSNPQQLTPTQSAAYAGPRPIQPMRLSRRTVYDSYSGDVIYSISEETKLKLSGQSIHQIHESGNSKSIGTIGFAIDSSDIAVILRGKDVQLRREGSASTRWLFRPSGPAAALIKKGAHWYWLKDKTHGGVMLADAKKYGTIIARIRRDVLSFERPGLAAETVAEICLAAMSLAELARRSTVSEQMGDLAASIAQVALGDTLDRTSDEEIEKFAKMRRRLTLTLR